MRGEQVDVVEERMGEIVKVSHLDHSLYCSEHTEHLKVIQK